MQANRVVFMSENYLAQCRFMF
uniref:Uncharacterized protein n=1 Tax=Arundo donax TaxID=35708 RepID=A0A0A9BIT6_ARUDO